LLISASFISHQPKFTTIWCWYSVIGLATGHGLHDRGVGVQVPVGSRIFFSPSCPDRLCGPYILLGNVGSFPGGKEAGAWSWPLTSNQCWGQENVDRYTHSPIWLHGIMLNYLSRGTTLLLYDAGLEHVS
jgi:hypothetical protein